MSEQTGKSELTLGFNVGRSSITAACVDGSSVVVEKFDWDVEPDDDGFAAIGKAIEVAEAKCGKGGSIGVAIPGLVESASGNAAHP